MLRSRCLLLNLEWSDELSFHNILTLMGEGYQSSQFYLYGPKHESMNQPPVLGPLIWVRTHPHPKKRNPQRRSTSPRINRRVIVVAKNGSRRTTEQLTVGWSKRTWFLLLLFCFAGYANMWTDQSQHLMYASFKNNQDVDMRNNIVKWDWYGEQRRCTKWCK